MWAVNASGFGRRLFFFLAAASPLTASSAAEPATHDGIRAEVHGRLHAAPDRAALVPRFQVSAGGIAWDLDFSADAALAQAARALDGKPVVAIGDYAQRRSGAGVRRVLVATSVRADAGRKGGERIDVTARGTLKTGVMAIGAETTGITLDAGGVVWEIQLEGRRARDAAKLDGRRVVVTGRLTRRRGVETGERFVVEALRVREERGAS